MSAARWRRALAAGTLLAATAAGPAAAQTAPAQPEVTPQPRLVTSPYAQTLPPAQALPAPGEGFAPPEMHGASGVPAAPAPKSFLARCKLRLQKCFLGYPAEFEAPPLGAVIRQHFETQVANGDAARMVLYEYDFVPGGEALNCRGRDRLAEIRHMLPRNAFPVVIERTPGFPPLAEARRMSVLGELAAGPFPVPVERVVIGPPLATGLAGVEAEVIYRNLIDNTQSRGMGQDAGGTAQPGVPLTPMLPTPTQR
jgi:hypothetical protein